MGRDRKPSVGTLCFATDQGLGILARSFYDAEIVTNALIVEHTKHRSHHAEWYPRSPVTKHRPFDMKLAKDFCASMDVMLFFETPFEWELIDHCRSRGIKTVLMVMHECTPAILPSRPDMFLAPSNLDTRAFPGSTFIPVPVSVQWSLRTTATTFVHNAGHGGLKGRNGTREFIESLHYVRTPINVIIRSQQSIDISKVDVGRAHVDWRFGTMPYASLWEEGDVFIFPEKFNGLSLPLQEARAAGMLVMCGDRFPMNDWLPPEPLIPVVGTVRNRIGPGYMEFDEARYDPVTIALTIDAWAGRDITAYSRQGKAWAKTMAWDALRAEYEEVLR